MLRWFKGQKRQTSVIELIQTRDYPRAIEKIRSHLEDHPEDHHARIQLADALSLSGHAEEAISVLEALADSYAREGFLTKAIATLKRIARLDPNHPGLATKLAGLDEKFVTSRSSSFSARLRQDAGEPTKPSTAKATRARRPAPAPPQPEPPQPEPPQPEPQQPAPPQPEPPQPAPPQPEPSRPEPPRPAPPRVEAPEPAPPSTPPAWAPPPAIIEEPAVALSPSAPSHAPRRPDPEPPSAPEPPRSPERVAALSEPPAGAREEPSPPRLASPPRPPPRPTTILEIVDDEDEDLPSPPVMSLDLETFDPAVLEIDPDDDVEIISSEQLAIDHAWSQVTELPLFSDFGADELLAVLRGMILREFDEGEPIISEGEPGNSLFILTTGEVEVTSTTPDGRKVRLDTMGEGEFFGEVAILTGKKRTATVSALEPCEALELHRVTIDSISESHPRVRKVLEAFHKKRVKNAVAKMVAAIEE